jgi:AMMECR1 domain-containing protein
MASSSTSPTEEVSVIQTTITDYQATYLPEVAAEQEWDKPTTLRHLIAKAGYRKNPDEVFNSIVLTTYESSKAKITYKEYLEMR